MSKSLLLVIGVCLLSAGCAAIGPSGNRSLGIRRLPLVGNSIRKKEFGEQVEADPFPSASQMRIRAGV